MTRTIVAIGIVVAGIVASAADGETLGGAAAGYLESLQFPDPLPVLGAAALLSGATVVASLVPAPRAPHAWTRYRRLRVTRKPPTRCE